MSKRRTITYVPGKGEKVTSAVLIGKWVVSSSGQEQSNITRGGHTLTVPNKDLIPVKPVVPPEPPAGSGWFVDDVLHVRHGTTWIRFDKGWPNSDNGSAVTWATIADRAIPAIPDPDYPLVIKGGGEDVRPE